MSVTTVSVAEFAAPLDNQHLEVSFRGLQSYSFSWEFLLVKVMGAELKLQ